MKMTREEMIATLGTRDPANNGKFIIGVLSTGIYCLPSCHARTPKPENVRFFANGSEAEAAGLRPCKKCRPDEYERGENRELESLEDLVSRVRANPSEFSKAADFAEPLDVGTTKLNALFRLHYQQTPADLLGKARLATAKSMLVESTIGVAEIAYEVGYENLSVFNDNFRRKTGVTPSKYRLLPNLEEFVVELPPGFNVGSFVRAYSRDPLSPTERFKGTHARFTTPSGSVMDVELASLTRVRIVNGNGLDAYETLMRAMNIAQDPGAFERLVENIGIGYVVEGRLGTRVPQTLSLFDGLIWAITGQQINLPFAFALRQRLFAKYGEPLGDDLYAVPSPDRLAEADPSELKGIQFSRQKADYLIGIARLGSGWLRELEEASFSRARAMLFTARGLGVWSANYILMRALGYPDCVPLGDTGLTSGLVQLHNLREKPTHSQIESMMQTFAPHRSLATYHLWQSLK